MDTHGLNSQIVKEIGAHAFIAQVFVGKDLGEYTFSAEILGAELYQGDDGVIVLRMKVSYDSNVYLATPDSTGQKTEESVYRLKDEDGLLKVLSVSTEYGS